jgi:hypothetical protein
VDFVSTATTMRIGTLEIYQSRPLHQALLMFSFIFIGLGTQVFKDQGEARHAQNEVMIMDHDAEWALQTQGEFLKGCRKLTTLDAMANRKGTERRNQESNNEK